MKKVIEKYYCDVCDKEVEKEEDLKNIKIPIPYYYDREIITANEWMSICSECNEALKDIIKEHFADIKLIWCVGTEIGEIKYKKISLKSNRSSETLNDIRNGKGLKQLNKSEDGLHKV